MPWTKKQRDVALAVSHGWKPKGEAKGFTRAFAEQVIEESEEMKAKRRKREAEARLGKGARSGD